MFFAQTKEVRQQYLSMQRRAMTGVRSTVMGYQGRGYPPRGGRMYGRGPHQRGGMQRMGFGGMAPNPFVGQMPGVTNFPTGPQGYQNMQQMQSMSNQESKSPMLSQGISTPPSAHSKKTPKPPEITIFTPMLSETDYQQITHFLKEHKDEFMKLPEDQKKHVLGSIMYKRISGFEFDPSKQVNKELFPKITGMLIDLEVLDFEEILEIFLENKSLGDRIYEAVDVINESN